MMKLIMLSGGKNVPWTNARREHITKLMGVDLFHTGNQVVKPTPLRQVVHRSIGTQTGTDESVEPVINHSPMQTIPPKLENNQSTTYVVPRGKRVVRLQKCPMTYLMFGFRHAKRNNVNFEALIDVILHFSRTKEPEYLKSVIKQIFPNFQSRETITPNVAVSLKSGKAEYLLFTLSWNLKINKLGKFQNLVQSRRAVQRHQSQIMENFIPVCKPEATFSGFRCDLVSCVKFAAWILYEKAQYRFVG